MSRHLSFGQDRSFFHDHRIAALHLLLECEGKLSGSEAEFLGGMTVTAQCDIETWQFDMMNALLRRERCPVLNNACFSPHRATAARLLKSKILGKKEAQILGEIGCSLSIEKGSPAEEFLDHVALEINS